MLGSNAIKFRLPFVWTIVHPIDDNSPSLKCATDPKRGIRNLIAEPDGRDFARWFTGNTKTPPPPNRRNRSEANLSAFIRTP